VVQALDTSLPTFLVASAIHSCDWLCVCGLRVVWEKKEIALIDYFFGSIPNDVNTCVAARRPDAIAPFNVGLSQ